MAVKRKQPDEVSNAFTRNGVIKYFNKTNDMKTVLYPDYQEWLDLPWPDRGAASTQARPNTSTHET